ncbi:MAG: DUF4469 domain-containing protein [Odoribacteraceae bacterium]|jgi:hypothetical protein|nr:DUF4469 domain-containing protein [Odoribacteraceae bacterium]
MKKYVWKVWLSPNWLTKDVENDYVAMVSTTGKTLYNEDIARQMVEDGSELQYETIFDILNRADRLRRDRLCQGYSVQTGLCHAKPQVTGSFIGSAARYDPDKHKITCELTLTAETRKGLEDVGVEVLGVKDSGARIGLVTDVNTGLTDGTITPDGDIIIEGEKIRVLPLDEPEYRVYLVEVTSGTETRFDPPYAVNDPKKIICRVPPVGAGEYTLRIITRFSQGGEMLKNPRTLEYELPLKVL